MWKTPVDNLAPRLWKTGKPLLGNGLNLFWRDVDKP
jgi:hypothetical protein